MPDDTSTTELLLCGGTGDLGGRIAARLAERGIAFRALVRSTSDTTRLQSLGAELSVGNLTDRASLDRAMGGIRTVVTTANSMTSTLAGDRSGSTPPSTPAEMRISSGPRRRPAWSGSCSSRPPG